MLTHRFNFLVPALEGISVHTTIIILSRFAIVRRRFTISILPAHILIPIIIITKNKCHTIFALCRICGISCNRFDHRPFTIIVRNVIIPLITPNPTKFFIVLFFVSYNIRSIDFTCRRSIIIHLGFKNRAIIILERNGVFVLCTVKHSHISHRLSYSNNILIPTLKGIGISSSSILSRRTFICRHFSRRHKIFPQNFIAIHKPNGVLIITGLVRRRISYITFHSGIFVKFRRPAIKRVRYAARRILSRGRFRLNRGY